MNTHHRKSGFFTETLAARDPEIFGSITDELGRQRNEIELIASENIVSTAVMAAQGSVLTNKYAEGYPGRRYYGGCDFVDVAEFRQIADWIIEVVDGLAANGAEGNAAIEAKVKAEVETLCARFPIYPDL